MSDELGNIRVLLVKHVIEGHDRGVKFVLGKLRDEGFETIYSLYRLPKEIVTQAQQEDVDVIGVTTSSRVYQIHIPELVKCLEENNMKNDVFLLVGGLVGGEDEKNLLGMGVDAVYGPGKELGTLPSLIYEFKKTKLKSISS
ncbi:MAG: cobalamin-dependent protein [Desulfobacteraceae bacterium]|jgi:methylmalonyl-CoA mutase cobalamin-binding domain/chain